MKASDWSEISNWILSQVNAAQHNTIEDKTRQENTIQDEAGQDKARQC